MMRKRVGALVFAGGLFGLSLLVTPKVEAELSLAVSPPRLDLGTVSKGDRLDNQVMVVNPTNQALEVVIRTKDLRATGDRGGIEAVEEASWSSGLKHWLAVSDEKIRLEPRAKLPIFFTVTVPKDAEPGTHYAGIFFQAVPQSGQVKVSVRVGVVVNLIVAGKIRRQVEVISFAPRSAVSTKPPRLVLKLRNGGNVHLIPEGEVELKDGFGKVVGKLFLPRHRILPTATRTYDLDWLSRPFFGYYQAQARVKVSGNSDLTVGTSFWVIPHSLLVVGVGLGGLLGRRLIRLARGKVWLMSLVVWLKVLAGPAVALSTGSSVPVRVRIRRPEALGSPARFWSTPTPTPLVLGSFSTQPSAALPEKESTGDKVSAPFRSGFGSGPVWSWQPLAGLTLVGIGLIGLVLIVLAEVRDRLKFRLPHSRRGRFSA